MHAVTGGRTGIAIRFVAAAVAVFLALHLVAGVVWALAFEWVGVAVWLDAVLAVVVAGWFVGTDRSLERLWWFVLAVFAAWLGLGPVYNWAVDPLYRLGVVTGGGALVVAFAAIVYATAYSLVYGRGGELLWERTGGDPGREAARE